jgi:hypothetical protein
LSRTWWLTTNTSLGLDEISDWLSDSQNWIDIAIHHEHNRLVAKSRDSTTSLACVDRPKRRPGSADVLNDKLGTPSTLTFTQELSRSIDHCGRLDKIYELAFRFAELDCACDLYFDLEDRGIFKRVKNQYVVNPDQFFAKSLAEFLTFPYTLADSDKRNELLVSNG